MVLLLQFFFMVALFKGAFYFLLSSPLVDNMPQIISPRHPWRSDGILPLIPRYNPPPPTNPEEHDFDELFEHINLPFTGRGEPRGICIVKRRGYYIGMKFFKTCEEAKQICSVMIFPEIITNAFTMKGVKFPVRIVAMGGGKVLHDSVYAPEVKRIPLPALTTMVIEIPACDVKVRGM